MQCAVIDIGTNTFHLIIAINAKNTPLKIIYKETVPVRLGEDSFPNGNIKPIAFNRGVKTMLDFHEKISKYKVDVIKAVATESLRRAGDSKLFIDTVLSKTGIEIDVISGHEEALLIFNSIKHLNPTKKSFLVMDIGGGSTEFILANNISVLWKDSYPIGSTILKNRFHKSDPIDKEGIDQLIGLLREKLFELFKEIELHKPDLLIGTSGSFETICDLIYKERGEYWQLKFIDLAQFKNLYKQLLNSTSLERKIMPGMNTLREPLMVVAVILINYVMNSSGIKRLSLAQTALKEGLAIKLLTEKN